MNRRTGIGGEVVANARPSTPSVFEVGHAYTREAISAALGGSRRACLPTVDGVVVAACLLESFNPDAPHVVLCGAGPRNGAMGVALSAQREPIPMFIKAGVGRWIFRGLFVVVETLTDGPHYRRCIEGSGRAVGSVSRVVLMESA